MATPGRNFCIAPFTQLTFDPVGSYSPCAEIGAQAWYEPNASPIRMWSSKQYESLRQSFKQNEKDPTCNRCWTTEKYENKSLRIRLLNAGGTFLPGQAEKHISQGYKLGPQQINLMTGNKCNLRCRICKAACSSTYNTEGKEYEKKLGRKTIYTSDTAKPVQLSPHQLDEVFEISGNLKRLEFYGGEPLLDDQTIKLLERFVEAGRSHDISIMYNTNGVNRPTEKHYKIWESFKHVDFNVSIDDIGDRFTYNRHPGKWSVLVSNIQNIREKTKNHSIFGICTVSNLNIFYIPEILRQLKHMDIPCFLNTVHRTAYYEIQYLPMPIKKTIKQKLQTYEDLPKIEFLLNMLDAAENLKHWEDFKFWTQTKDQYRKESFKDTYPEFYKVIKQYDNTIQF